MASSIDIKYKIYDRTVIKNMINYIKTNEINKLLELMHKHVENEGIVKAIHDYLLGVNCRNPRIKFHKHFEQCGIYKTFISRLDFEMFDDSTRVCYCPCGADVCYNWKYFIRPNYENNIWVFAPMEMFTNEYFQKGFLDKI